MDQDGNGLDSMVQGDDRLPRVTGGAVAVEDVSVLSPDDDAWLSQEPSATPDVSWIEDDLQDTPTDELMASEPVTGRVPDAPEIAFTPPPGPPPRARAAPLRRPVIERVRPREELRAAAVAAAAATAARVRPPARVLVAPAPSRVRGVLLYAGAILAGLASGAAVLLLGR